MAIWKKLGGGGVKLVKFKIMEVLKKERRGIIRWRRRKKIKKIKATTRPFLPTIRHYKIIDHLNP